MEQLLKASGLHDSTIANMKKVVEEFEKTKLNKSCKLTIPSNSSVRGAAEVKIEDLSSFGNGKRGYEYFNCDGNNLTGSNFPRFQMNPLNLEDQPQLHSKTDKQPPRCVSASTAVDIFNEGDHPAATRNTGGIFEDLKTEVWFLVILLMFSIVFGIILFGTLCIIF